MSRYALIVDPYGAATGFAPAFRARGVCPVAVLSTPEPRAAFVTHWHPEQFAATHPFTGDFDHLVASLKAYDLVCVIPGNESGVEFAEALGEALTPGAGNVPELTAARRDKWQMAQALQRAGVPALRQICTADPDEVTAWIHRHQLEQSRLVLKPPKSGGTEDVHLARPGEWPVPFERVLGTVNIFGIRNEAVLVQEFVTGTEYIVDGYSVDGRYGLAGVCRYHKHAIGERLGIYDGAEFLPPDVPEVAVLADYTRRVADAVGIRNGCSHAEVMLTPDGPRLIEIGARASGMCMQECAQLATGDSQIDRTVRHWLDGQFTPWYALHQHAWGVWLSTPGSGVLRNIEALEAARDLPSMHSLELVYRNGDQVPATVDLFTILGVAIMVDPDASALRMNYLRLRELERQVVVDPIPPSPPSPEEGP